MNREPLIWTKQHIGSYWSAGDYSIATVCGGGEPAGYQLFFRGWPPVLEPDGRPSRYPTWEAAQQAAEKHYEGA